MDGARIPAHRARSARRVPPWRPCAPARPSGRTASTTHQPNRRWTSWRSTGVRIEAWVWPVCSRLNTNSKRALRNSAGCDANVAKTSHSKRRAETNELHPTATGFARSSPSVLADSAAPQYEGSGPPIQLAGQTEHRRELACPVRAVIGEHAEPSGLEPIRPVLKRHLGSSDLGAVAELLVE